MAALSETGQWVRFADAKAGLLAAGLGVVLAGTSAQAGVIVAAIAGADVLGTLVAVAFGAWALALVALTGLLMHAIGPRTLSGGPSVNRFAWPSLVALPAGDLDAHLERVPRDTDAWRQVAALAALASKKYKACGRAVVAFVVLVMCTATMVALAHVATR